MEKKILKFPRKHVSYAPRFQSRRFGQLGAGNVVGRCVAYRSDGGTVAVGDDGADPEQVALLKKIGEKINAEFQTRNYSDEKTVKLLLESTLKGIDLEALRKYEGDTEKIAQSIRNVSAELEKVKNIRAGEGARIDKESMRNTINSFLEGTKNEKGEHVPSQVELMMRSKGQHVKEVSFNIRAAATMSTTNVINENNFPLEMIESMSVIDAVVKKRYGTQYIFSIASHNTVAEVEEYTTWLEEGDEQGAFAIVSEGAVKPLVSKALVRNYAKARKIAGKMVITEEFAKWRPKAWQQIKDLINDKLVRDYNAILTVDLQAQAVAYVGTTLDGTFATPTDYDAIGAVAAQIETLNFIPDVLILHPQDKWRLTLEKDSQGRYYMMIPMVGPDGMITMMGFRVITSTYQVAGSFTLGESGLFKIEDETFTVRMGYGIDVTTAVVSGTTVVTNVSSDFDTNKMRIIVETFFKDWIATPYIGSYATASFNTVKLALQKP